MLLGLSAMVGISSAINLNEIFGVQRSICMGLGRSRFHRWLCAAGKLMRRQKAP